MRYLNTNECSEISGGEDHSVVVVDPIAGMQAIGSVLSADRASFSHSMKVIGMLGGAAVAGLQAYQSCTSYGLLAQIGGSIFAGAAGMFAGGIAMKATSQILVGAYDSI